MEPLRWDCEDDEESLGLATILERAGSVVTVERDLLGEPTVVADRAAAELTAKILDRYARDEEATLSKALDRRERAGRLGLLALCVVLGLAGVWLWP